jgi:predicted phage terminase large subunit-like protein
MLIFDDIENLEEAMSDVQRTKRKAWFRQDAMRAGWEDTKVFAIGNLLHHACLLADLSKNPLFRTHKHQAILSWADDPELWAQWEFLITDKADSERELTARRFYEAHRATMDRGAVSAWPEAFSYYDLMVMRASEGHPAFATEMMNDPLDPSRTLFHKLHTYRMELRADSQIWLMPLNGRPAVILSKCWIFGATDPSMGKTKKADYTAIIVMARASNGYMFVLDAIIKRITPDQAMEEQNKLAGAYTFTKFGIESNQFQALFKSESATRSLESGNRLPIDEIIQSANKELRIQSLEPDLTNGYIMFPEHGLELLIQQLTEYPLGEYDDGPDALEMVRTIATSFKPLESTQVIEADSYHFVEDEPGPRERDRYQDLEDAFQEKMRELDPDYDDEESRIFVPVTMV